MNKEEYACLSSHESIYSALAWSKMIWAAEAFDSLLELSIVNRMKGDEMENSPVNDLQ
jgi:hypothetical protein